MPAGSDPAVPPTRRRFSRRGMVAAGATVVLVIGVAVGYFVVFPQKAPAFVRQTLQTVGLVRADWAPPAPTCPLTGEARPSGTIPDRPALAIKIENHPDARPQAALNDADVVVEEPVEGGYTRFIAIFHCGGARRVGPVRSGRTTDPDYLRQLGHVVFGYAGAVNIVRREVADTELVDVNFFIAVDRYTRDPSRPAPHDVYTTTAGLWKAAHSKEGPPPPLFGYSEAWEGKARRVAGVHLPYSPVSDVHWNWRRASGSWFRSHGSEPHLLEDGSQVSARNIVIQVVRVTDGTIIDPAGNPSPEVDLTGSGRAYVLRDGRLIIGRWERSTLDDVTRLVAKDGSEITLAPGRTWVELLPSWVQVELLRNRA